MISAKFEKRRIEEKEKGYFNEILNGVGERFVEGEVRAEALVDLTKERMPEWVARIMWES